MKALFKVLVCGGRKYFDRARVRDVMLAIASEHADENTVLFIHGDAPGADTLCKLVATENGYHAAAVPALWRTFDKAAGAIRNGVMLALGPDLVVAFPGGRGTADMVKQARNAGVFVVEVAA
jgi:hypothetical protein